MKLQLDFNFKELQNSAEINDKILLMGSCFSENIGTRLQLLKRPAMVNPLGIAFHPLNIYKQLGRIVNLEFVNESDFILSENVFKHYDFHSSFYHEDKNELKKNINNNIILSNEFIKNAKYLFLTFGTGFGYELTTNNTFVNNCHKQPSSLFNRLLSHPDELLKGFENVYKSLKQINRKIHIVITVSPVKHYRDGIHENNISKSILHFHVFQIRKAFKELSYFPAFEIVNDELRDYRFYESDFAHPNTLAIDYIFEKFLKYFYSEKYSDVIKLLKEYAVFSQHKLKIDTKNSRQNKLQVENEMINRIKNIYPEIILA